MIELTIKEAHKGLKSKEFSCTELTKAYLDQIKKTNEKLNSYVTITTEQALEQAEIIDEKGNDSWLYESNDILQYLQERFAA